MRRLRFLALFLEIPPLTLKTLCTRLTLAIVVPVVLATVTLYPIFRTHLDARLEGVQASAEAMLEAGHESLQRGMNESLSHALATAEMPLLKRYLSQVGRLSRPIRPIPSSSPLNGSLHCLIRC